MLRQYRSTFLYKSLYVSLTRYYSSAMEKESGSVLVERMKSLIPPLSQELHKGQAGRVGIFGGSLEYTGAPYFAAISSLKTGADLAHVFCHSQAAPVIKSYSPELIVHPLLDSPNASKDISEWLPRLHTVILGPGLGRTNKVFEVVKEVLEDVKKRQIPIIIDADGLFFLNENFERIANYNKAILTPNAIEFTRLYEAVMGVSIKPAATADEKEVRTLAEKLGNVTILCKGKFDVISDGKKTAICETLGSPRRCGGQGDMLGGILSTFVSWAFYSELQETENEYRILSAAYSAALMARLCSKKAFAEKRRSTLTTDMIPQIQFAFEELFNE